MGLGTIRADDFIDFNYLVIWETGPKLCLSGK